MPTQREKAEAFMALHTAPRGFLMPNVWDAGSAIVLAEEGFQALGTTSAGIAFSLGKPDYDVRDARLTVGRDEMLGRIRQIVDAVPVPVSGDLEDGYGASPEAVAETVRLAIEAGLAGGNVEDNDPRAEGLYDEGLAVERICAAREAIDASGSTFVLTARTDAFLQSPHDRDRLKTCIRRASLFREEGADCIYPCGVGELESIETLVRELDAPINIVTGWGDVRVPVPELLDAGVARISVGGSLARSALGYLRSCARELGERGTVGFLADQIGHGELNAMFARGR
ncbi:MAG TPA: isocitrate lyase/phosphoenolpyruvate mutase family protein [Gemmatimonadaceae bacterium]